MRQDGELLQEYRQVRQALSELAAIYNDAPVGLAVIGTDFRYQRINNRLAEMNGLPAEAHIGRTIREAVPKLADIGESLVRKIAETGEPILNLEIDGETDSQPGVVRSFLASWSPVRGDEGTVVAVNLVVEETTAQKRAARALQASEATVHNVLNTMGEAFLVLDRSYRITLLNSEAARISGGSSEDMLKRGFFDLWPGARGTRLETLLQKVMTDKEPGLIEYHCVSEGHDLWLDLSAYPTSDGIAVFYRDISARRQAEDELKRSERRLATALRAGRLGAYEVTLRPKFSIYWDSTIRQIWGVGETEEITEDVYWKSIHPEDLDHVREQSRQFRDRNGPRHLDFEYRIRRWSDRALRWVRIALDSVSDEQGPYRMIGTAQDITERKAAEEHAELLMREINHRSKNLLAVVQSIAQQMTKSGDLTGFPQRFAERLAGLASSQDLLVKNFWKGVPLSELIASQLSHYKHLLGRRILLRGEDLRIAPGAAQNLGMAIHELGTNAAKYGALTGDAGEVAIAWDIVRQAAGDDFVLSWTERNGPPVTPPAHKGLGTLIVTRLFKHALSGEVSHDFAAGGVRWSIRAPAVSILESD